MRRILNQLGIRREDRPALYRIALVAVLLIASNGATFSLVDHEYEASLREREAGGAAPAIQPIAFSETGSVDAILFELESLGAGLPAQDLNQQRAERRDRYGDITDNLAHSLALNGDPAFQTHIARACAILEAYWPWKVSNTPPCGN